MAVMFSMEKPFSGNVYTKGHFMKDECRQKGDALATAVNITIAVDSDCGLRRRRTVCTIIYTSNSSIIID